MSRQRDREEDEKNFKRNLIKTQRERIRKVRDTTSRCHTRIGYQNTIVLKFKNDSIMIEG